MNIIELMSKNTAKTNFQTVNSLTSHLPKFGKNDDTLLINNEVRGSAGVDMGNGNNTVTVGKSVYINGSHSFNFGSGNDTFNIGINLDGQNVINMGEGNNTLAIGASKTYKNDGYIGANSKSAINFGAGDDIMTYVPILMA